MSRIRRTCPRRSGATVASLALALLVLGLGAPAYAAKPADPGGGKPTTTASTAPARAQSAPAKVKSAVAPGHTKAVTGSAKAAPARAKAPRHAAGNASTTGSVTSPQPRSKADDNGVGANRPGPYDSTRNGAPSQNGKGDDKGAKATGRPCAGCVGKADNKNPRGQLPGGSDHNAGYECDRNQGVGKTNPAHTGCRPVTPPTECVDDRSTDIDECNPVTPPPGCVAGNPFDDPATSTVECSGSVSPPEQGGPTPPLTVARPTGNPTSAGTVTTPAAAVLPHTGSPASLPWLAALGLLLMVGGGVVTARVRQRA
jgi:LPXTG-motif cell wall-anchored protein